MEADRPAQTSAVSAEEVASRIAGAELAAGYAGRHYEVNRERAREAVEDRRIDRPKKYEGLIVGEYRIIRSRRTLAASSGLALRALPALIRRASTGEIGAP
jgi:hypothetical protein